MLEFCHLKFRRIVDIFSYFETLRNFLENQWSLIYVRNLPSELSGGSNLLICYRTDVLNIKCYITVLPKPIFYNHYSTRCAEDLVQFSNHFMTGDGAFCFFLGRLKYVINRRNVFST